VVEFVRSAIIINQEREMAYTSYKSISPKVQPLFDQVQGMTLVSAQIVENGFAFIYENSESRMLLRLLPSVYTQGKNIVDPINDMTMLLELRRFSLDEVEGDEGEMLGKVEMAYSAWFGEDFL
jgi:hypothetical protein